MYAYGGISLGRFQNYWHFFSEKVVNIQYKFLMTHNEYHSWFFHHKSARMVQWLAIVDLHLLFSEPQKLQHHRQSENNSFLLFKQPSGVQNIGFTFLFSPCLHVHICIFLQLNSLHSALYFRYLHADVTQSSPPIFF